MKQNIEGNRYDYVVEYSKKEYFIIYAIRKKDGRKSAITNLNTIIGEVIYPVLNTTCVENSDLDIKNKRMGRKLYKFAIKVLSDKHWVNKYLESDLDEDFYNYDYYEQP
jgi:hypothetical protein